MRATKKKRHSFGWRLSIYALFLLALTLTLLVFFYFYIAAYEYSRPESAMQRYIADMGGGSFQNGVTAFVDTLDHKVQSEAESRQRLLTHFANPRYAKKPSECTEDRLVYVLKGDSGVLGKITLTPSGTQRLGFADWQATEEVFDFEQFCQETEAVVPAGYQVRCGDCILDESYIVDDRIHYALLEEFYDDYEMPTLRRYRSGRHVGEVELEILDPQGKALSEAQLEEDKLTDNCSAEEKTELQEFTQAYIERYVTYLSGVNGAHWPNLYATLALTVPDSDLYSRLYQALGGQGHSTSLGDTLQTITLNHLMNLGEGRYLVDVTYLVDTYGQGWVFSTTTNNAKLLVQRTDEGLRAYAQASY